MGSGKCKVKFAPKTFDLIDIRWNFLPFRKYYEENIYIYTYIKSLIPKKDHIRCSGYFVWVWATSSRATLYPQQQNAFLRKAGIQARYVRKHVKNLHFAFFCSFLNVCYLVPFKSVFFQFSVSAAQCAYTVPVYSVHAWVFSWYI